MNQKMEASIFAKPSARHHWPPPSLDANFDEASSPHRFLFDASFSYEASSSLSPLNHRKKLETLIFFLTEKRPIEE